MIFILNKHVVLLIVALKQSLVFASSYDVDDKPEAMANRMMEFALLPWGQGLNWILNDSNSPRSEEVKKIIRGIESGEIWALEVLDILLKIQKEIPKRNIQDSEVQDQCIAANAPYNHNNIRDTNCPRISLGTVFGITGKSCGLPLAVCNLSSAVKSPVVQLGNGIIQSKPLIDEIDLEATNSSFLPPQSKDFTSVEISAIIFFSGVGAFMIACTTCDIIRRASRIGNLSTTMNTLSKFSLYTNALSILNTGVTPDMMPAIHGIRCLGFCSILIAHHSSFATIFMREKLTELDIIEWKGSWVILYMQMVPFIVDTFFVISGFLASHLFFKSIRLGRKINWPMVYIYRYLRVTPCLGVLILFAGIFSHRAGSGPSWETVLTYSANHCRASWWLQLLYIQNLVKDGFMCLAHTWFIAADMQLFWITPIILYPLHRWPKIGLGVLGLFFAASIATPAAIVAIYGYSNAIVRMDTDVSEWFKNVEYYYLPTYNRACPYLVGILLGYDVATKRRCLTQVNVVVNWLVTGTLLLLCIWFSNRTYHTNFAYNSYLEIGFAALSRPSWAFAMAWVVYACTQGYGGVATRFLSSPIFFPLSRLSFCIYLVHVWVQAIMITPLEISANYFILKQFYGICVDLVVSIVVALVLSLFIESPVIVLAKILMTHGGQAEQTTPVEELKKKEKVTIQS